MNEPWHWAELEAYSSDVLYLSLHGIHSQIFCDQSILELNLSSIVTWAEHPYTYFVRNARESIFHKRSDIFEHDSRPKRSAGSQTFSRRLNTSVCLIVSVERHARVGMYLRPSIWKEALKLRNRVIYLIEMLLTMEKFWAFGRRLGSTWRSPCSGSCRWWGTRSSILCRLPSSFKRRRKHERRALLLTLLSETGVTL